MNTPTRTVKTFISPMLTCCVLLTPWIGFAQQTTAATPVEKAKTQEPPVELAPFEVRTEKDVGYAAQNTTSGSRLNTSLADTPSAISVFTKEFIEDIGATNIEDLMAYAVNSDTNLADGTSGQLTNSDPVLTIRGLQAAGAGSGNTGRYINFFQSSVSQDTFNMERAELNRGPNSVLFGVGTPAGGFNVDTKKANVHRDLYEASFRFGSRNEARATIDVNQPVIPDKVGIRINAVSEDRNDWRAFAFDREQRYQFDARWQVAKATRVDVEYEFGRRKFANAAPGGVLDSITPWIAAGRKLDTQVGAAFPANAGIQVLTTGASLVYDSTTGTIYNVRNQSVSAPAGETPGAVVAAGEDNPDIFDFKLVPRKIFLGGPGYGTNNDYDRITAIVSHEVFKDLFLEAAFNRETVKNNARDTLATGNRIQVDTNALLPDGTANPRAGQFYVEQTLTTRDRTTHADDFRFSASYDLNAAEKWGAGLGRWLGSHRFAALYLARDADQQDNQQRESLIVNPLNTTAPDNASNGLRRRTYFDLSGPAGLIGLADFRQSPINNMINQTDGKPVTTTFVPFGQPRATRDLTLTNLFVWQANLLDGRLVATVGYRKDRDKSFQSTALRYAPVAPFTQGILYAARNANGDYTNGITRTQGLVAKPFTWFSIFYNHSLSFNLPPRTVQILPGAFAPSSLGETNDFGAKFPLMNGKIFATVTYYKTTSVQGAVQNGVGTYLTSLNNIWATLSNAGVPEANGVTVFANGYTLDQKSNGLEFELTANPTPNWRFLFNFSADKTINANAASEIINYYTNFNPLFTQGTRGRLIINGTPGQLAANAIDSKDGVTTIAEQLQTDAANIQAAFVSPNGVRQLGKPVAQANLRTTYLFREGMLRGFSAGIGLRWRGERVLAYTTSDPATRQEIRGADSIMADANVAYHRRVALFGAKHDLTVQLNVNNLLDNDDLVMSAYYADGKPKFFNLPTPRQCFVTTTLKF